MSQYALGLNLPPVYSPEVVADRLAYIRSRFAGKVKAVSASVTASSLSPQSSASGRMTGAVHPVVGVAMRSTSAWARAKLAAMSAGGTTARSSPPSRTTPSRCRR